MICMFGGRCRQCRALDMSMFILRGRHSTLDVWFSPFLANRIVHDTVQIACQACGMVRVSFCVVGAALSEDLPCVDCHFDWQAQYLGRFHDCNLAAFRVGTAARGVMLLSTFYILHLTVSTSQASLYTSHSILYTSHFAPYTLHLSHLTFHTSLQFSRYAVAAVGSAFMHMLHITLHILRFTLHVSQFKFHNLHFTPYTLEVDVGPYGIFRCDI